MDANKILEIWENKGIADEIRYGYLQAAREYIRDVCQSEGYLHATEDGDIVESWWLGTVTALSPSGKYWLPFADANVPAKEAVHDMLWREALDQAAEELGGYIDFGPDSPEDIYFVVYRGQESPGYRP